MLVYGFINSLILALTALGFSITFGISGVANFAHGAFYILGGTLTWLLLVKFGLPYFLSAIIAVITVGIIGALMYRFLLVRLRGLVLSEVIATFAIGIIILELMRCLGVMGFQYRLPSFIIGSVEIFGTYVRPIGIGGIARWQDAVEFLLAGASAIQVGTALFTNPGVLNEIVDGLSSYCRRHASTEKGTP